MIKFLVMDVDGTLTDGKIYMGVDGEFFKAFDIKDGYALHTLLKENGIIPVIITARMSPMVEHRCKELGVTEIHQGVMNKLECLKNIIEKYSAFENQYDFSNVAYIGDDLLDLQCMNPIKEAGGVTGCPSNAAKEVLSVSDFIAPNKGGEGAVRDFVDFFINQKRITEDISRDIQERLNKAIEYLTKIDCRGLENRKYEVAPDFYYTVQEYFPFKENEAQYESHRKYIDIQYLCKGIEKIYVTDIKNLCPSDCYNEEKDVIHYLGNDNMSSNILVPGSVIVLFPKDAHMPSSFLGNTDKIKKIVGKLLIDPQF